MAHAPLSHPGGGGPAGRLPPGGGGGSMDDDEDWDAMPVSFGSAATAALTQSTTTTTTPLAKTMAVGGGGGGAAGLPGGRPALLPATDEDNDAVAAAARAARRGSLPTSALVGGGVASGSTPHSLRRLPRATAAPGPPPPSTSGMVFSNGKWVAANSWQVANEAALMSEFDAVLQQEEVAGGGPPAPPPPAKAVKPAPVVTRSADVDDEEDWDVGGGVKVAVAGPVSKPIPSPSKGSSAGGPSPTAKRMMTFTMEDMASGALARAAVLCTGDKAGGGRVLPVTLPSQVKATVVAPHTAPTTTGPAMEDDDWDALPTVKVSAGAAATAPAGKLDGMAAPQGGGVSGDGVQRAQKLSQFDSRALDAVITHLLKAGKTAEAGLGSEAVVVQAPPPTSLLASASAAPTPPGAANIKPGEPNQTAPHAAAAPASGMGLDGAYTVSTEMVQQWRAAAATRSTTMPASSTSTVARLASQPTLPWCAPLLSPLAMAATGGGQPHLGAGPMGVSVAGLDARDAGFPSPMARPAPVLASAHRGDGGGGGGDATQSHRLVSHDTIYTLAAQGRGAAPAPSAKERPVSPPRAAVGTVGFVRNLMAAGASRTSSAGGGGGRAPATGPATSRSAPGAHGMPTSAHPVAVARDSHSSPFYTVPPPLPPTVTLAPPAATTAAMYLHTAPVRPPAPPATRTLVSSAMAQAVARGAVKVVQRPAFVPATQRREARQWVEPSPTPSATTTSLERAMVMSPTPSRSHSATATRRPGASLPHATMVASMDARVVAAGGGDNAAAFVRAASRTRAVRAPIIPALTNGRGGTGTAGGADAAHASTRPRILTTALTPPSPPANWWHRSPPPGMIPNGHGSGDVGRFLSPSMAGVEVGNEVGWQEDVTAAVTVRMASPTTSTDAVAHVMKLRERQSRSRSRSGTVPDAVAWGGGEPGVPTPSATLLHSVRGVATQ